MMNQDEKKEKIKEGVRIILYQKDIMNMLFYQKTGFIN